MFYWMKIEKGIKLKFSKRLDRLAKKDNIIKMKIIHNKK